MRFWNTTLSLVTFVNLFLSNSTLGIKIEVPADWLYKEINNTAITFLSAPNETNRAAIVVYIEKVPSGMFLVNFTQRNIQYLHQSTPSFHLITSNLTSLAGSPAYQIVFTSLSNTGHDFRKGMSIWTLKNDKAYIITYRAEPGLGSFSITIWNCQHQNDILMPIESIQLHSSEMYKDTFVVVI